MESNNQDNASFNAQNTQQQTGQQNVNSNQDLQQQIEEQNPPMTEEQMQLAQEAEDNASFGMTTGDYVNKEAANNAANEDYEGGSNDCLFTVTSYGMISGEM